MVIIQFCIFTNFHMIILTVLQISAVRWKWHLEPLVSNLLAYISTSTLGTPCRSVGK